MTRLTLQIFGPIQLADDTNNVVSIKSVKARALLAIIATAPGNRCQRAKLTELLWSKGKAQESLRQDLRKLRKAAGADVFLSGPGWLGLNPDIVAIAPRPQDAQLLDDEFGADLDTIREPAFEDWLRDRRQALSTDQRPPQGLAEPTAILPKAATRRAPTTPVRITLGVCDCAEAGQRIHAEMLLRDAANRAAPMMHAEIVEAASGGSNTAHDGLLLSCRASGGYGSIILQPQIVVSTSGEVVWTQMFSAADTMLTEMLADAVAATTVALVAASNKLRASDQPSPQEGSSTLVSFSDVFSFDRKRLLAADKHLAMLQETNKAGSILALRALIRHNQMIERFVDDPLACLDEADRLAHHAVELSPNDPLSLAVASQTSGLVYGDEFALELARKAKQADPDHAFVRQSLSVALSFTGYAEKAHDEAIAARCNRMASLAPSLFYIRNSKTAIGIGDRQAALRWAVLAIQTAPEFRAAHRVVAALAYHDGQEELALRSLKALERLEPDFSLDLMESDEYPVFTLRAEGLLSVTRSGLI